jgi:hypothetical protein
MAASEQLCGKDLPVSVSPGYSGQNERRQSQRYLLFTETLHVSRGLSLEMSLFCKKIDKKKILIDFLMAKVLARS